MIFIKLRDKTWWKKLHHFAARNITLFRDLIQFWNMIRGKMEREAITRRKTSKKGGIDFCRAMFPFRGNRVWRRLLARVMAPQWLFTRIIGSVQ